MTATLSKRHQARNERVLQELIKTVPGNDRCADCGARNPGWASWSLGIFLCLRCASLHRKLGTHVSKVKSLSMDTWSNEQVDNMKNIGNTKSNRKFNPQNAKPSIPLDVDEVDLAMERFLRQKYEQRLFSGGAVRPAVRHDTGSTRSSDDLPPPLPPKPGRRFGFGLRAASSTFPMSRKDSHPHTETVDEIRAFSPPPLEVRVNKQSRVFGASVGSAGDSLESKLTTLRDMGFPDDKRNSNVLKGLNGNLERAIESLVRLGEGGPNAAKASLQFAARIEQPPEPRSEPKFGATIVAEPSATKTVTAQKDAQAPNQRAPLPLDNPNGGFQLKASPAQQQSYNPFEANNPYLSPTQPIEDPFSRMLISQPLFPNNTGGHPSAQQTQLHSARLQQSMTPPVPQLPNQYIHSNPFVHQQQQAINGSYNPFFSEMQPEQLTSQIEYQSTGQVFPPLDLSQNQRSPHGFEIPRNQYNLQPQPQPYENVQHLQLSQQQQPFSSSYTPIEPSHMQYTHPQPPYHPQPQPIAPQRTGRYDKSSILALYNYPQPVPQTPGADDPSRFTQGQQNSPPQLAYFRSTQALGPGQSQRSVTMPVQLAAASRNPFVQQDSSDASRAASSQPNVGFARHVSQESVDVGSLHNGRHSPDAFASLSARYVR